MENVIASLLREFEQGKVTRRQFVQTLAMIAAGAPAASAIAAAAPPRPAAPLRTTWLDHISFSVSDYKRSTEFYTGLMGWTVLKDTGTQAMIDINGFGGIIIRNARRPTGAGATGAGATGAATTGARPDSGPRPATPTGASVAPVRPPVTAVIDHISWGVQPWDTEAIRAQLVARGLTPREDTGGRGTMETSPYKSFHVRDPDGWDLQISNQTKEAHDLVG